MSKHFAIILSGCGHQDGAEIHEATMSMLAVQNSGHDYRCFAPNIEQHQVTNHLTGQPMPETRNVLIESARIARGQIQSLDSLDPKKFDALLLPGGYGAAMNLCSFKSEGADCQIYPGLENIIKAFHDQKKPIGALCISPVILARILNHVKVTAGDDAEVEEALQAMGAEVKRTTFEEVVIDHTNKVVTGPCYMLESSIIQIARGAQNVVNAMLTLMEPS